MNTASSTATDWDNFNPAAGGLAIEIPLEHRSRAILARQQKRRDPIIAEEQALYLRLKGYTVLQISCELECSQKHVYELIKRARARREPELQRAYQEYVDEQVMQIEHLWTVHHPRASRWRSAEILLRLMERKAKLLGLDKPTKIEQVPPPLPRETDIDESLLTVEELRQLRVIVAAAQERAARAPIEGQIVPRLEHDGGSEAARTDE